MFIHKFTRLNCDLTMAYRYFVVNKLANLWLGGECEIDLKKKKFDFKTGDRNHYSSSVVDFNREEILVIRLADDSSDKDMTIEVNFMKCSSRTEFCTEIHLVHKGFDIKDEDYKYYENHWGLALDKLREIHNKDWIISDNDLSLGILQGSRI